MSQNRTPKEPLEIKPHGAMVIDFPMAGNVSTGGGHGPEDRQGYPPQNLNLVGKSLPAMPEVSIPALHKKSRAVIDRPYRLALQPVGALYERPRCISCAKPAADVSSARPAATFILERSAER